MECWNSAVKKMEASDLNCEAEKRRQACSTIFGVSLIQCRHDVKKGFYGQIDTHE